MNNLNFESGIEQPDRSLFMCGVININPSVNTIDVYRADSDSYIYDVIVSCSLPSSYSYGERYSPSFVNDSRNMVISENKFSMWAICAYTGEDFSTAVCVGFLPPRNNELTLTEYGLKISRHESDVISLIRADGTTFFYHPSGTYFKIGKDDSDLIANKAFLPVLANGLNINKRSDASENGVFIRHHAGQQMTLDSAGSITIKTVDGNSIINMTPSGEISISTSSKINVDSPEINVTSTDINVTSTNANVVSKIVNVNADTLNLVVPVPTPSTPTMGIYINGKKGFTGGGKYTIAENGIVYQINPN